VGPDSQTTRYSAKHFSHHEGIYVATHVLKVFLHSTKGFIAQFSDVLLWLRKGLCEFIGNDVCRRSQNAATIVTTETATPRVICHVSNLPFDSGRAGGASVALVTIPELARRSIASAILVPMEASDIETCSFPVLPGPSAKHKQML
jgi:hypothetical protein